MKRLLISILFLIILLINARLSGQFKSKEEARDFIISTFENNAPFVDVNENPEQYFEAEITNDTLIVKEMYPEQGIRSFQQIISLLKVFEIQVEDFDTRTELGFKTDMLAEGNSFYYYRFQFDSGLIDQVMRQKLTNAIYMFQKGHPETGNYSLEGKTGNQFIIRQNEQCALYDLEKDKIVSKWYEGCGDINHGLGIVYNNRKPTIIINQGKEIVTDVDEAHWYMDNYIHVEKDGLVNMVLPDGTLGSQAWFEEIGDMYSRRTKVVSDGKYGYIDQNGELVIPAIYSWASDFTAPYARVSIEMGRKTKTGMIDTSGNLFRGQYFDDIFHNNGLVMVRNKKKYGLYSLQGKEIYKTGLEKVYLNKNHHTAFVHTGKEWFFIDSSGTKINKEPYQEVERSGLNDGTAIVAIDGKYGVIDGEGNVIIDFLFDQLLDFGFNLLMVEKEGNFGAIDKKGKVVIPLEHDDLYEYWDYLGGMLGIFAFQKEDKIFLFDESGKQIEDPVDEIPTEPLEYGCELIPVKKDGKYAFFSYPENRVTGYIYDGFYEENHETSCNLSFDLGMFFAKMGDKYIAIDNEGNEKTNLFDEINMELYWINGDGIWVKENGKWGFLSATSEYEIKPILDEIPDEAFFEYDLSIAQSGGKEGVISYESIIVPFEYDEIYDKNNFLYHFSYEMGFYIGLVDEQFYFINGSGEKMAGPLESFDMDMLLQTYNYCWVKKEGKHGFYDILEQRYFINPVLDHKIDINMLEEYGFQIVSSNNKETIINSNFELVKDFEFDEIYNKKKCLYDMINETGIAIGIDSEKYTVFNVFTGKTVPGLDYVDIEGVKNGYEVVKIRSDNKTGLLTISLDTLMAPKHEEIVFNYEEYPSKPSVVMVKKNGWYGLVDMDGNSLTDNIYEKAEQIDVDLYKATREGNSFILEPNGNEIPGEEW